MLMYDRFVVLHGCVGGFAPDPALCDNIIYYIFHLINDLLNLRNAVLPGERKTI